MKKLSFIIALLLSVITFAQEKQWIQVDYKTELNMDVEDVLKKVPAKYRVMVEDQLRQELADGIVLDYVLKTNGTESTYEMVEQITNAQDQGGMIAQRIKQFDKGVMYKNLETKQYLKPVEMPGANYLLKDSLIDHHWKITREKETVAGFETRKANGYYVYQNDSVNVVAWFAPKIAVKDGPSNFWGLPGLILKAEFNMNDADFIVTATNVAVKNEDIKIDKPTGGKEVTQKEFEDEIKAIQEKYKEMMEGGVDTD